MTEIKQTGSLDLRSAKAAKDTAIENADAINVTPWFSYGPPVIENVGEYWSGANTFYTVLDDGWGSATYENTTSSDSYKDIAILPQDVFELGQEYTFLLEWRNTTATGSTVFYCGSDSDHYQFVQNDENPGIRIDSTTNSSGSDRRFITCTLSASDPNVTRAIYWRARFNPNSSITGEFRLSVYKGRYYGGYRAYIDQSLRNRIANNSIGGRNLLRKTATLDASDTARTRSTVTEPGILRVTPTTSAAYVKVKVDYLDYKNYGPGVYTVSFDARLPEIENPKYTDIKINAYIGYSKSSRIGSVFGSGDSYSPARLITTELTHEWQRFSTIVRIPYHLTSGTTDALVAGSMLSVELQAAAKCHPVEYRHIKLEIGDTATEWTPAPEDVENDISEVRETANNAAPKATAIKRTQRIYYRSNSETKPTTPGNATANWVTQTGNDIDLTWTTAHLPISSTHKFIYTCEQSETNAGVVSYTTVLLDDTITVIDGGKIITGSITANKLDVYDATIQKIRADAIDASSLSIGYSQLSNPPSIPSTVAELSDSSNYATTTALTSETNQRKAIYGTCPTAAGTTPKVVTLANYELDNGKIFTVKFTYANTKADKIQLNVNSTGAKDIWAGGAVTGTGNQLLWAAGAEVSFYYDGAEFVVVNEPRSWYGACNTAAATAAKTDTTPVGNVVICRGTKMILAMTNANTHTAPTLNIRSTGAKAIYAGTGTVRPLLSNGLSWAAGYTQEFIFDGAAWRIAVSSYSKNYVTVTSDGVKIHMNNDPQNYQHQTATGTTFYVGGKKRSSVIADGLHVYVGDTELETAKFTADGAVIGLSEKSHIEMDYHSLKLIDKDSNTFLHVSDLRDSNGVATVTETFVGNGVATAYNLYFIYAILDDSYIVNVSDSSGGTVTKARNRVTFESPPTDQALITVTYHTQSSKVKAFTFGSRADNSTVGAYSVAMGSNVTSSGAFSFAGGSNTITSGDSSHAEGSGTTASGSGSHAEGLNTTASGYGSHAEGRQSTASGSGSHAEGLNTTASGYGSHAEGRQSTASGSRSHAEGSSTTASGNSSHAEGKQSIASGEASHAEGSGTTASSGSSHTEGSSTTASGNSSHAEGYQTTASGDYSHAQGWSAIASGEASHAEGDQTNAIGKHSHAEGWRTRASGDYSHAEGSYCYTDDNNANESARVYGKCAHAEGSSTTASGSGSHAEGSSTTASGNSSHAEGSGTTASSGSSHTEGSSTTASGNSSHAEGWRTRASGNYSHAEGSYCYTDNNANESARVYGECAHAEGYYTTASSNSSHSEGSNTTASGNSSHAEGYYTTASGDYSHAEGYYTTAAYDYTHASGKATSTSREAQTVVGQYNSSDNTAMFIVGNGSATDNRSNAFTVCADGIIKNQFGTIRAIIPNLINRGYTDSNSNIGLSGSTTDYGGYLIECTDSAGNTKWTAIYGPFSSSTEYKFNVTITGVDQDVGLVFRSKTFFYKNGVFGVVTNADGSGYKYGRATLYSSGTYAWSYSNEVGITKVYGLR